MTTDARTERIENLDPMHDCGLLGVVRAVCGLKDSVVIVHGRPGCHSGMLALQAATSSHKYVNVIFSGLRSEEMVTGGEARLRRAIINTYKVMKPRLIVVASASAVGIMGDDVDGVIREVSSHVRSRIIHIQAHGYTKQEQTTYEETLREICRTFMRRDLKPEKGLVNIIGFHADEPHWYPDILEMRRLLEKCGIKINCILTWTDTRKIENIGKACLNIVLGGEGITVAELIEKELGIPYIVVPYPIGTVNTEELLEKTCKELNMKYERNILKREYDNVRRRLRHIETYVQGVYGVLRVAIIGESWKAFYLARFLEEELGETIEYVGARLPNKYTEQELSRWREVSEIVIDRVKVYKKVRSIRPEILYASSYERDIALRLGVPLVRMFYPTVDEVDLSRPLVGPRGSLTIIEKTINELARMQEKTELAYLSKMEDTEILG